MPLKVEAPALKPLIARLEATAKDTTAAFRRVTGTLRRGMKTEAANLAVVVYNVGKQRLGKDLRVTVIDPTSFVLTGIRRPISLVSYGARGTKKGLVVQVLRGDGKKRIASGFIATGRSGNRLPFVRETKKRLPIRALTGPSAADMLKNTKVLTPLGARFTARASKELLRVIEGLARRG